VTQTGAQLLLGALIGFVLGAAFYAGLWATVRRASRATWPWAWFTGSFLLRLAVVGLGLLLLARSGPWPFVGALVGLVAARPLVTYQLLGREERAG